jgi:hypothetical protein
MSAEECKALAVRADPLKVRLEAEEILSGFHEAEITWPPIALTASLPAATHTRVCFPNRIFYRQGGAARIKCNYYSCPTAKASESITSRPVVTLPSSAPSPPSPPRFVHRFYLQQPHASILLLICLQMCSFVVSSPPPPSNVKSSLDTPHTFITLSKMHAMRVKWDLSQPALLRALSSADTFVEVGAPFIDRHYNFRTGVELRSRVKEILRSGLQIVLFFFRNSARGLLTHVQDDRSKMARHAENCADARQLGVDAAPAPVAERVGQISDWS